MFSQSLMNWLCGFCDTLFTTNYTLNVCAIYGTWLTSQATAVEKCLMPFWWLDVEKVKKHVQDDVLESISLASDMGTNVPGQPTLVDNDGIRRPSTKVRRASLSWIQKYIRPRTGVGGLYKLATPTDIPLQVRSIDAMSLIVSLIFSAWSVPLPYASVTPDSAI